MTATPIPRTLTMTVYGDMDLSIIREKPKSRKPIKTYSKLESKIDDIIKFIKKEIKFGNQVFWVCPLIEESKKLDHSSAVKKFEYLEKVGLGDWSEHLPSELSGGQKQRIAIARALASQPKVLLADEPTGALDSTTSEEVMALIKKINKEGKTILVVTHEHEIANMCNRIITLKDGVIVTDIQTS